MEKIIIEKQNGALWNISQGDMKSEELGWDEMMGLIASLTMPEPRPCLNWMKKASPKKGQP